MIDYAEIRDEAAAALVEAGDVVIFAKRSKGVPLDPTKWWRADDPDDPGQVTTSVVAVRDESKLALEDFRDASQFLQDPIFKGHRKYIVAAGNVESTYRDDLEDFDVVIDEGEEWKIVGVPEKVRQGGLTILYIFQTEKSGRKAVAP